jgi:TPR repeat protein
VAKFSLIFKKWKAKKGDVRSQLLLGYYYGLGIKVNQDYSEAVNWFMMAANREDPYAQFWVGTCYLCGDGVSKDIKEALRWLNLSADSGFTHAQDILSWKNYKHLDTRDQKTTEAVRWLRLAISNGDADSQYNLGNFYSFGVGSNSREAYKWFCLAAKQGDIRAIRQQHILEDCYGYGGNEDIVRQQVMDILSNYDGHDSDDLDESDSDDGRYDKNPKNEQCTKD